MSVSDRLYELPSVHDLFQRVADDLVDGKSVIFMIKDGMSPEITAGRFYSMLGGRELSWRSISVGSDTPLETILKAQQIMLDGKPNMQKLVEANALPDVLLITDLEYAGEAQQRAWFDWLREWAEKAQARSGRGQQTAGHLLVLPATASLQAHLPATNVFLRIWHWSDCLSSLELRLLCHMRPNTQHDILAWRWREYILPELSSLDAELANSLWEVVGDNQCSSQKLLEMLKQYGRDQNWKEEEVCALPDEKSLSRVGVLNREQNYWYMRGWLYRTPEYGWELHSALHALRGDERRIAFRFWRGQSYLLLPLLDQIRRHLIEVYGSYLGPGWHLGGRPSYWPADKPFEEYDVEWTWLASQTQDKEMRQIAKNCRELRNQIAHYKPVMLRDYRTLVDAYSRLQEA